ncbi:MAG: chemotaxis protein CheB [Myxococcota bacterium]
MASSLRILVVDHSVVYRRLVRDSLASEPGLDVIATAANGEIARAKIGATSLDAIVLDDEAYRELREILATAHPELVVVVWTNNPEAAKSTAPTPSSRIVAKPPNPRDTATASRHVQTDLVAALRPRRAKGPTAPSPPVGPGPASANRAARRRSVRLEPSLTTTTTRTTTTAPPRPATPFAIGIGASTGGPNALARVVEDIGRHFALPIAITQHMPPTFTATLARRLDRLTDLAVREARPGDALRPGSVLIAPGGSHLVFVREGAQVVVQLSDAPPENSCRPAVDVMFRALAACYGPALVTVVLTGMGSDGVEGVRAVRRAGGRCIVQDEPTSTVWGMPGAVHDAGLADQILPLDDIGRHLRQITLSRGRSAPVGRRAASPNRRSLGDPR